MKFRIDKQSEISAHQQLREQIIFLISTGELAIGQEMPSVRALSRQLGLSVNTVSKVYSELARANWLLERAGAHHKVIVRNDSAVAGGRGDIDSLIDRTVELAHAQGYSLQALAERLRERLLEQPADHLLIVEPDAGLGIVMREEIRERIGYAPPVCTLSQIENDSVLRIGAVVVTPAYLIDRLHKSGADMRRIIPVEFSPLDALIARISELPEPSLIGWISASAAGLKTISGIAAPAAGNRHSNQFFLFECDGGYDHVHRIRRYRPEEYKPGDILKPLKNMSHSSDPTPSSMEEELSTTIFQCMDLVFCDSVAAAVIKHRKCVSYRLLSQTSLQQIELEAAKLPRRG